MYPAKFGAARKEESLLLKRKMEQEKEKRRKRCHAAAARVGSVAFTQLGSRRSLNYMVELAHVVFFTN